MNNQIKIKQYDDYGFTPEEISKELDLNLWFIELALEPSKLPRTYKANLRGYKAKAHPTNHNIAIYELLFKHGPKKINRFWKKYGIQEAAKQLNTTLGILYALKQHFGYHQRIPKNALDIIKYWPEQLRREVDKRDDRKCVRCIAGKSRNLRKYVLKEHEIRYFKIDVHGKLDIPNCATLCRWCYSNWALITRGLRAFKNINIETIHKLF